MTFSLNYTITNSSSRESISDIKLNSAQAYYTQDRMVTAEDYKGQILSNFNAFLDDVTSYGGADNVPPIFGKVFVGLKFKSGILYKYSKLVSSASKGCVTD